MTPEEPAHQSAIRTINEVLTRVPANALRQGGEFIMQMTSSGSARTELTASSRVLAKWIESPEPRR